MLNRAELIGRLGRDSENRYTPDETAIEGHLRTRKWQAQDGSDRYTTEINADALRRLDRRNGQEESASSMDAATGDTGASAPEEDIPL